MYLYADVDAGNVNGTAMLFVSYYVNTNITFVSIKMYKYL